MRTIFDKILVVEGVSSTQTYMSLNESFQREIHVDCLDD
jgi:Lrp/AsnC family transcriptional regulator for asnA, asnC and gidA